MVTKLTLKLDKEIIERAKKYAGKRHISLSKIVEKYFKSLTYEERNEKADYSPLIKELSGIINLKSDSDIKDEYTHYLIDKYK
ncbi:MAG: DUF6364 family protein [bacterium]